MEIKILTQPKSNDGKKFLLGDKINSLLTSKRPIYKKATFAFGLVKEKVIDTLIPNINNFISNGGELEIYMSLDRKSTTKNMLTKLLDLGIKLYAFLPEDQGISFQPKLIILEANKSSEVFLPSGNMTYGGFFENPEIITHISYDENDIKTSVYSDFLESLNPAFDKNQFTEVTYENIDTLHDQGYLASGVRGRNYDDIVKIKSIAELKNSYTLESTQKKVEPEPTDIDDSILVEIPDDFVLDYTTTKDTSIKDINSAKAEKVEEINISTSDTVTESLMHITEKDDVFESMYDIPEENKVEEKTNEPIYYINDDAIDVEDMLFQKSKLEFTNTIYYEEETTIPTSMPEKKSPPSISDYIKTTKAADLSKTAIFMIHANKIAQRGTYTGEIKIPSYLRDSFDKFWNWPTKYTLQSGEIASKVYTCTFKIIDVLNSRDEIVDENVSLIQREGETSFSIISDVLKSMKIEEFDILRFIKENDGYTCEIIRKDAPEYRIWDEFCSHSMKGSKRKYGIS